MNKLFARPHVRWLSLVTAIIVGLMLGLMVESSPLLAADQVGQVQIGQTETTVARVDMRCFRGTSPRCANRIFFRMGSTSRRVFGRLFGINDRRFFVLHARAGQHMRVNISGAGATRGIVTAPSGAQNGQPGGLVFDENLSETGDYIIQVSESSMANAWVGDFHLDISIR